jgi:Leucine-rich repeat (LRR) protein
MFNAKSIRLFKCLLTVFLTFNLSFIPLNLPAQTWVNIPDANFISLLQDIIPAAVIGNQLNTESPVVANTFSLDVDGHGITNLFGIQFFTSLTSLNCSNNGLLLLPPLPPSLTEFYCNSNQLESLPDLPASLTILDCSSNQLTNLPVLPSSLKRLACSRNNLAGLPTLPGSLTELICYGNKINCIPVLPNSIVAIDISNNSFTCIPNYIKTMENDSIKYPLCEIGNKNGCAVIPGKK